jgi:hypothetical protein
MHNKDIIFDMDNKKVGLVDSNCSGMNIVKNITYVEDINITKKTDYEVDFLTMIVIAIVIILIVGLYRLKNNRKFLWIKVDNERSDMHAIEMDKVIQVMDNA